MHDMCAKMFIPISTRIPTTVESSSFAVAMFTISVKNAHRLSVIDTVSVVNKFSASLTFIFKLCIVTAVQTHSDVIVVRISPDPYIADITIDIIIVHALVIVSTSNGHQVVIRNLLVNRSTVLSRDNKPSFENIDSCIPTAGA